MRRAVIAVVALSLIFLPAALSAGLPQYNGCHGEVQITQTGDAIGVAYDETRLYQQYTYYVRSYGGAVVLRISVLEMWHEVPPGGPATNPGMRNPESVRHYYRTEYSNIIKATDADGKQRDAFIDVYSGPMGLLIQIITVIPVETAPKTQGDEPVKEAQL